MQVFNKSLDLGSNAADEPHSPVSAVRALDRPAFARICFMNKAEKLMRARGRSTCDRGKGQACIVERTLFTNWA